MALCADPLRVWCCAPVLSDGMVCDRCARDREEHRYFTVADVKWLANRVSMALDGVDVSGADGVVEVTLHVARWANPDATRRSVEQVLKANAPIGTEVRVDVEA